MTQDLSLVSPMAMSTYSPWRGDFLIASAAVSPSGGSAACASDEINSRATAARIEYRMPGILSSRAAVRHKICDRSQPICTRAEVLQRLDGVLDMLARCRGAGVNPDEPGISILAAAGVFVRLFSELLGGGSDVEDVVDDLESESEVVAVRRDGAKPRSGSVGGDGAHAAGA